MADSEATKTRTYVEMRSPEELVGDAGAVTIEATKDIELLRPIYNGVRLPWNWPPFEDEISDIDEPNRFFHVFRENKIPIGMSKSLDHGDGDIEIVSFGLLPEFRGQGLGGCALVALTNAAWDLSQKSGPNGRVWLHTSSRDHEHALANYTARGFKVFKIEERSVETTQVLKTWTPEI